MPKLSDKFPVSQFLLIAHGTKVNGKIASSPKNKHILHFKSFFDKCLSDKRVFQTVKIWNKITFLEIQNII